jgi:Mn-containing catalase
MFFHDGGKLQYSVRVERPNPLFAKMLQQAIGGVEGEIRVMMQYMFQAWGSRGPKKYRDMLLETGTEEIGHIEMLATAVALNLEGAPVSMQDDAARTNPMVAAIMGGMSPRQYLSTGLAALPADAEGHPVNASHVYASGNAAADMYANVTAEASGRALAVRLYNMTDDSGMQDMLQFLIARDTMHQNQWLAALEDMGGVQAALPIPNSHPQSEEHLQFSYTFISSLAGPGTSAEGRWSSGPSIDGKGRFSVEKIEAFGEVPQLAPPVPGGGAQSEQMTTDGGKILNRIKDAISG